MSTTTVPKWFHTSSLRRGRPDLMDRLTADGWKPERGGGFEIISSPVRDGIRVSAFGSAGSGRTLVVDAGPVADDGVRYAEVSWRINVPPETPDHVVTALIDASFVRR